MSRKLKSLLIIGLLLFACAAAYGQGLKGEYFKGMTLTGTPVLTRIENVNFNWGGGAPDPVVGSDTFSVRWTGGVTAPETGNFRFATRTDDGVRVYLSGELIINNWSDHSATWNYSPPIAFEKGKKYGITVEFYENGGDAVMELYWSGPGLAQQIIPGSYLSPERVYQYLARKPEPANGATGVSMPLMIWTPGETALWHDVYFGTTPDLGPEQLMGRQMFTMYYHAFGVQPGVTYYWRVDEVEKDATTIHTGEVWSFTVAPTNAYSPNPRSGDKWIDPNATLKWNLGQDAARHDLYFSTDRDAVANRDAGASKGSLIVPLYATGVLAPATTYYWAVDEYTAADVKSAGDVWSFTTMGPGGGIKGEYFNGMTPLGIPAATRIESQVDFTWPDSTVRGEGSPDPAVSTDQFSCLWTADLEIAVADTYTFVTSSDEGVRLYLNDQVIIDNWTGHTAVTDISQPIALKPAIYSLRMEYYENTGSAVAQLSWETPSLPRQFIRAGSLQPPLRARAMNPAPDAIDVPQDVTLLWGVGEKATKHDVYFGDDPDAVANATTASSGIYRGQQAASATSFDPPTLEWGKTYYWRIDEVNPAEADSPWKGSVWSFTTANFIVVDNFESYNDEEGTGTRIYETWIDGLTNQTTSTVGHWDPPFAEQTIVHAGRQSMPIDYNNTRSPFYAEAEREFSPVQNWTLNAVDTLVLYLRGNPVAYVENPPGTFLMSASGADIWNAADEFRFACKRLSGNGSIVAKVESLGNTNGWAKAGVMIRESLDPGSKMAYMVATPGQGVSFGWRQIASDTNCGQVQQASVQIPVWVKLTRTGDAFTAQYSADGKTWTDMKNTDGTVTSTNVLMSGSIYIGLCLTSHDAALVTTSKFSGVAATNGTGSWQMAEVGVDHPGNSPQPLYVVVEDSAGKSKTVTNSDPLAVNVTEWTPWSIPLSEFTSAGVSLSKVKKMTIGVGNRNSPAQDGAGLIYIDDIRVIKTASGQ